MKPKILPYILFGLLLSISFSCSKDSSTTEDVNGNVTSTVQDKDGNTYKTVVIGTQTWMAENLKTTKYNDGTAISFITDNEKWLSSTTGAYCWYNNDVNNKNVYGALYNWYTVNTGKLCPTGWHVPTNAEWTILTTFLGGEDVAGGKLKESGTSHWASPNSGATNTSGFTAVPGGYRHSHDSFNTIGSSGNWWSSSERNTASAWHRGVSYNTIDVSGYYRYYDNQYGFSVRCLKN